MKLSRRIGWLGGVLLMTAPLLWPHAATDWAASGPPHPALKVGEILPPRIRTPQFPLKDARTLFTDAEIAQARANVAKYPAAKAIADTIIKEANYWVAWSDEDLRNVVSSAEVPRAFDCCTAGCPVHGKKIFEVAGTFYPWIIDPRHPFQVKCPIGGETYPSNDYGKFYRSGFKDRSDFNGPYVDDGRGWVAPDGQRYWFVAHANHWVWFMHGSAPHMNLYTGLAALGRAYLLTGDARYAHTAAMLLRRIAEVYPNMDHESQSRFGEILAAKGERYTGKVINAIWESYLVAQFGETYDAIWETIDHDAVLQKFYGQDGRAIRGFIEANILEEGMDAYDEVKTRGNYGMHQRSLLVLAIVRQHADNAGVLARIIDHPDGTMFQGLRYALYSLMWRDGEPYESPEYNAHWVGNLSQLMVLLPRLGRDVATLPRLRRLFDAPIAAVAIGRYTPAVGDSFSVYGGTTLEENSPAYEIAYQLYRDPRYAQVLAGLGATGEKGFHDFASLLHPPVEAPGMAAAKGRILPPQPSRLLSGYGLSLLNNPNDTIALSLYHGLHVTHTHYDRLHFDLFAHGQAMMPDLGYPDAMNELVSGIYTWSLNTISHNTVTVDASTQPNNVAGVVELQADGGWARAVAVSAKGTYPQCDVYRRTLVMVDTAAEQSYAVDIFDVRGGHQHDYSLHGPPGTFALAGGKWSAAAPGTYAGENVALGEIYDDAKLGAKDYKGGYATYRGSGFQHLSNVRRLEADEAVLDYTHEKDPQARLRVRVLPQPDQQLSVAEARVTPVKFPQIIHFALARRKSSTVGASLPATSDGSGSNLADKPASAVEGDGASAPLSSRFVSVLEPHAGDPFILEVRRVELPDGVAVTVRRAAGTDVIVVGKPGALKTFSADGRELTTRARVAVASWDQSGKRQRSWEADDGGVNAADAKTGAWLGEVTQVDLQRSTVHVRLSNQPNDAQVSALVGRVVHFGADRRVANTVISAEREGDDLVLELRDDVLVGLGRVKAIEGRKVSTRTHFILSESYPGSTVFDAQETPVGRIASSGDDWLELETAPKSDVVKSEQDLWIAAIAPGDAFLAPSQTAM